MEKVYQPQKIEEKIYQLWEKGGYFKCQINKTKKPFVIIMPPPNTTGYLHMGHALFVTIEDCLIRYHRLKKDPTLWLPGFDHAGIATQVVFEQELAKEGKTRFDLGREEFCRQTLRFAKEKIKGMKRQLKKLGASCDWSRTRFTLEPEIIQAVYWTFKKMYDEGLIYQGERIINWCPRCKTALSDLEVEHEEKMAKLYYINYPIFNSKDFVTIATTRPETMLGDVAVAVNPKDKRYQKFLKAKVKILLPIKEKIIPLISDERVDINFGTGAVKITPGHDPLDFEIGKSHKLPLVKVINEDGKMTKEAGEEYQGLERMECRKKILEELKKLNLLLKEEDYKHSVAVCERCKTILEPLVSKQWFVRMENLAKKAIEVVKRGEIKIVPKRYEKIYFHWLKSIQDWCISRQIWWGIQLPIWYCKNCNEEIVEIKTPKFCPQCKGKNLERVSDVLDTWFSSSQWPFLVFGWPKKTKDFQYFYPTTVMETGYDILFFWVARMIMMGLYCTKKIPFKYVYLHGLVRDKFGQKMSKSRGNVVDPMNLIEKYGADATRFGLIWQVKTGQDLKFDERVTEMGKKFCNKIWNATRFVLLMSKNQKIEIKKIKAKTEADKQILDALNKTIKKINQNLENFKFGETAETLYHFFWHNFCDKYIESSKIQLKDKKLRENTLKILFFVLLNSLIMLHPFIPFITEEIYQKLPIKNKKKSLMIETWPK